MVEPWTPERILQGVTEILEDALGVDGDDVMLNSGLVRDLGAESIDFLDIIFRAEKRFEFKIPRQEGFPETDQGSLDKPITPAIFDHVQRTMPFIGVETYLDPATATLGDMYTVEFLCKFVAHKLGVEWVAPQIAHV